MRVETIHRDAGHKKPIPSFAYANKIKMVPRNYTLKKNDFCEENLFGDLLDRMVEERYLFVHLSDFRGNEVISVNGIHTSSGAINFKDGTLVVTTEDEIGLGGNTISYPIE